MMHLIPDFLDTAMISNLVSTYNSHPKVSNPATVSGRKGIKDRVLFIQVEGLSQSLLPYIEKHFANPHPLVYGMISKTYEGAPRHTDHGGGDLNRVQTLVPLDWDTDGNNPCTVLYQTETNDGLYHAYRDEDPQPELGPYDLVRWEIGTAICFNSRQWHSGSNFELDKVNWKMYILIDHGAQLK